MLRKLKYVGLAFSLIVLLVLGYFKWVVIIPPPQGFDVELLKNERVLVDTHFFSCKNNWLKINEYGLWEMYLEGSPSELGVMHGILSKDLIYRQELAFVQELKKYVPSRFYQSVLKYFVAWFNRNLDKHIKHDYLLEIFGVCQSASRDFDYIGPAYLRFLNYHAAHDMGHALSNMGLVGCTSFATWDKSSQDSLLIIGRNFDFHVNDAFSEEKIIAFYKPDKGYDFMFVTWGGMIGVVSGMNKEGLTVTLNAAPSNIPRAAKTPISILAREILQYAANIDEAFAIAQKYETFVSESILIGSAQDNKTAIIEKSTTETHLFMIDSLNQDMMVCANHFQSDAYANNTLNTEAVQQSDSPNRFARTKELIDRHKPINVKDAALILRDRMGLNDKDIGMGNENAINQLIAHHSIIFMPSKKLVWVSTSPYQLGSYIAYDLNRVFEQAPSIKNHKVIFEEALSIEPDTFLYSRHFEQFIEFKKHKKRVLGAHKQNVLDAHFINTFIELNPSYYLTYIIIGDYFISQKEYSHALYYFQVALKQEGISKGTIDRINEKINTCRKHI